MLKNQKLDNYFCISLAWVLGIYYIHIMQNSMFVGVAAEGKMRKKVQGKKEKGGREKEKISTTKRSEMPYNRIFWGYNRKLPPLPHCHRAAAASMYAG